MYYEAIQTRQKQLSKEISKLQQEISTLPAGALLLVQNGKYTKWFQSDGHHPIYIPKRERALAQKLAYKKYLSTRLRILQEEQQANAKYLESHPSSMKDSFQALLNSPNYNHLFSSTFTPLSDELAQWMNEPFQGNPKNPEQLIHQTTSGILVRSKSESLISMLLHTNKIPFRYEAPLHLDGFTIYPDFTIRHPLTGEYFYWEHFGMMDNEDYRRKAYLKIDRYITNDILPSVNLITTFETRNSPLNIELVASYIQHFFLR